MPDFESFPEPPQGAMNGDGRRSSGPSSRASRILTPPSNAESSLPSSWRGQACLSFSASCRWHRSRTVSFSPVSVSVTKRSRVCAIGTFALYLLGRIDALASGSRWGLGIIIGIMILSVFFNAVRASFAHRRMTQESVAGSDEGRARGQE